MTDQDQSTRGHAGGRRQLPRRRDAGAGRADSTPAPTSAPVDAGPAARRAVGRRRRAGSRPSAAVAVVVAVVRGASSSPPRHRARRPTPPSSATCPSGADRLRRGPPRPARRPAPRRSASSSRSSRASPTRPRSTPSSTRSSTSSSATRRTASRPTRPTSSRGSTASSRSASARCRTEPSVGSGGDPSRRTSRALALLSIKDEALAQAWFDAAIAKAGATTTTETYNGVDADAVSRAERRRHGRLRDHRRQGRRRRRRRLGQGGRRHRRATAAFADEPESEGRPRLRPTATTSASGTSRCARSLDWSSELAQTPVGRTAPWPSPAIATDACRVRPRLDGLLAPRRGRRARDGGRRRPSAETQIGPTDEPRRRPSPSTSRRTAIALVGQPRRRRDAQARRSSSTRPSRASSRCHRRLDQGLGAPRRRGRARRLDRRLRGRRRTRPDGTLEVASSSLPTDAAAAKRLFTSAADLRRPRWRPGGRHRPRRGLRRHDDHDRRPRSTSVRCRRWPAVRGARPAVGKLEIAYAVTDDVVVIGSGPGFVKHVLDTDDGHVARLERPLRDARRPGRRGHGRRRSSTSPPIRELIEKAMVTSGDAADARGVRDRRQAVPRAVRRAGRGELGRGRPRRRSSIVITVK